MHSPHLWCHRLGVPSASPGADRPHLLTPVRDVIREAETTLEEVSTWETSKLAFVVLVPRLDTERTLMREWREGDLDAFAAMVDDAETMRFLGGVGTREEAWRGMALHVGHWQLRGYGTWAVQRRDDGAFIGRVGLWNPEGWPALEVGWTLARGVWGQGYATETARASMQWAWSELGAERLISLIAAENKSSIRVAERLGMAATGHDEVRGVSVVVYEVARPA